MEKVIVNPAVVDGQPLRVEDELGRKIVHKKKGNTVNKTTYISRLIKAGDLVLLAKPKKSNAGKAGSKKEE